ncbi:hypothetical protein MSG28_011026 [Choristoneura fumiferana]|uniref:Uncharacterized protein n=1 Tax=Choristoneura fumiferana TaxID=7141 RepID=A0ACC0KQ59_CHOFU|nr:hypothetical protein MSG28_011026 [Choristoneura fumiferana]
MRRITKNLITFLSGILLTALYCEFIIYYVVIAQCTWPELNIPRSRTELRALIIADTHLLGSRKGHWLDKWRREWQMHRAFQSIMTLHEPETVFVLGDLFDEGEWSSDKQFQDYVERFYKLFLVPDNVSMQTVVGNHDIGFHYKVARCCRHKLAAAYPELDNCMTMQIRLAHFPLYRMSDALCTEPDAPPLPLRNKRFRNKIDSLSREATTYLTSKIKPRAVFGGHTHHGCLVHHKDDKENIEFYEYSVPSFSWRNRPDPKYMLVTIRPESYVVNKCGLPKETTIAITAVILVFITCYYSFRTRLIGRR